MFKKKDAVLLAIAAFFIASQTVNAQSSKFIEEVHRLVPLPGALDRIPVVNSNSPEVVQTPGILVSTFPPDGKAAPEAHLGKSFSGRFDVFAHHIAKVKMPGDLRTLYVGLLLGDATNQGAVVRVLRSGSYVSQPDAPFVALPPYLDNADGAVFAGPGDRVMTEMLLPAKSCQRQEVSVGKGGSTLLANLAIPIASLEPPINGRSTLYKLDSSAPVYVATLAMFAPLDGDGKERPPTLEEWVALLRTGQLAGPREREPSKPDAIGPVIYGRVAGVAIGTEWKAKLAWPAGGTSVNLSGSGQKISFPIGTVRGGTFGTGQIQSAPITHRQPGSAYAAHGNYGIKYDLELPLRISSGKSQVVDVLFQSPIKSDADDSILRFNEQPPKQVFFRGTVKLTYRRDGKSVTQLSHLVQRQGEQGQPLLSFNMKPGERQNVRLELFYPPDATPPQVVTVRTR